MNETIVAGLVNTSLHSIFRQVDMTFQQTPLSHSGNNYPYKAYIETILKTNENVHKEELTSQLFYKDVGPDTDNAKSGPNSGLFNRSLAMEGGKVVDLEGYLLIDVFQQPKLLLNGVSIGNKLWPSLDSFSLVRDTPKEDLKVQIFDAPLRLCVQRIDRTYDGSRKNDKNGTGHLPLSQIGHQDRVYSFRAIQFQRG